MERLNHASVATSLATRLGGSVRVCRHHKSHQHRKIAHFRESQENSRFPRASRKQEIPMYRDKADSKVSQEKSNPLEETVVPVCRRVPTSRRRMVSTMTMCISRGLTQNRVPSVSSSQKGEGWGEVVVGGGQEISYSRENRSLWHR